VTGVPARFSKQTKLATVLVALTAPLILAPSAHADPTDDMNYIQELYAMGMDRTTLHAPTPQAMLDLGHSICQTLGNGRDPDALASHIEGALPNLSMNQAQFLISAAVTNYCPNVLPRPLPWSPQH
jgi:hypothetical protein